MKTEKTITITLSEIDLQVIQMSLVDSQHDLESRMDKWRSTEGLKEGALDKIERGYGRTAKRHGAVKAIIENALRIIRHG